MTQTTITNMLILSNHNLILDPQHQPCALYLLPKPQHCLLHLQTTKFHHRIRRTTRRRFLHPLLHMIIHQSNITNRRNKQIHTIHRRKHQIILVNIPQILRKRKNRMNYIRHRDRRDVSYKKISKFYYFFVLFVPNKFYSIRIIRRDGGDVKPRVDIRRNSEFPGDDVEGV